MSKNLKASPVPHEDCEFGGDLQRHPDEPDTATCTACRLWFSVRVTDGKLEVVETHDPEGGASQLEPATDLSNL